MSLPVAPVRSAFRLSAAMMAPTVVLGGLLWWLGWLLHASRAENASLRAELTDLRLVHRATASRESLSAEALRRAARLEEALAVMDRPPLPAAEASDTARAAELERVISFLRGEITAAHEIIERLKQNGPEPQARER
jgi:hypothetical protein